jgi:hypothetical protein
MGNRVFADTDGKSDAGELVPVLRLIHGVLNRAAINPGCYQTLV